MLKIRPEKNQIDNEYAKQICFCANVSLNAQCVFLILEFKYISRCKFKFKMARKMSCEKTCKFGPITYIL